jgi:hypothetical protein
VSPALAFQYVSENPPDLRNAHKTSSRNRDQDLNVSNDLNKRKKIEDTQYYDDYYVSLEV